MFVPKGDITIGSAERLDFDQSDCLLSAPHNVKLTMWSEMAGALIQRKDSSFAYFSRRHRLL